MRYIDYYNLSLEIYIYKLAMDDVKVQIFFTVKFKKRVKDFKMFLDE